MHYQHAAMPKHGHPPKSLSESGSLLKSKVLKIDPEFDSDEAHGAERTVPFI